VQVKRTIGGLAAAAQRGARGLASVLRERLLLLACATLVLGAYVSGALQPVDNQLAAWRAGLVQRAPSGSLVVVEIDSQSLRAAHEWPWSRARFAQAITNLRRAGAGLVAVDVDFTARSDAASDAALGAAIDAEPGSIVLPTFVQPGGLENAPLASLSRNAVVASVNIPIDTDGRARRYARGFHHHGHYHQSLAAAVANARYGDESSFLIDYGVRLDEIYRLSFDDVYRGRFPAELVRGRTILIGATALELGDEFSTPVRPGVTGVYVHALAAESLVQGRALNELNPLITLLMAFGVFAILWPGRAQPRAWGQKHAVMLALLIAGPVLVQALAPLSLNLSIAVFAQAVCFFAAVQTELARRTALVTQEREEALRFAALHDPETNLPNRRAMLQKLREALDSADGHVVIAIAMGVERFAMLRAAIGYTHANTVITRLAGSITQQRHASEIFHLSTAIIGMVVVAESEAAFRQMSAPALTGPGHTLDVDGQEIEIDVRVGVSMAADGAATADQLLEQAAIALDHARMLKRRLIEFNTETFPDPRVQLALTSDIVRGLERGDFSLVYQAKADARTGACVGGEALIRWRHPELGDVEPDRFIAAAEETGAIDDLSRWVLRQALRAQAEMRSVGIDVPLSINLSGRLLVDGGFCAAAIDAVEEAAANLCIEITETAIISDPQAAMASIAGFRAAGMKISIDDYGAGLSSLSYLKQIAADELKLDKSLIGDIRSTERDRLILRSTIDLAHSLGMQVVAEGVEDDATHAVLVALGCDTVQGYLISKPIALGDFIARFAPRRDARIA